MIKLYFEHKNQVNSYYAGKVIRRPEFMILVQNRRAMMGYAGKPSSRPAAQPGPMQRPKGLGIGPNEN